MFKIARAELVWAWEALYADKSKSKRCYSRGIDEISVQDFKNKEEEYLNELYRQITGGFFKFKKLKEYSIKRIGKSDRLIQAPCVRDRIVQKIMNDYMMRKMRERFLSAGVVGSIEGTTVKRQLLKCRSHYRDGYSFVLKTDIINFFPTIDPGRLRKIFHSYFDDSFLRELFEQYLSQTRQGGIPQGTPISPFMANLYLLSLDEELSERKDIIHFRYIDDFIVFCKSKDVAEEVHRVLAEQLAEIGLITHPMGKPDKTMISEFNTGEVSVLGIIMKYERLLIRKDKYKAFIDSVILPIKYRRVLVSRKSKRPQKVSLDEFITELNHVIRGWSQAYGFCDMKDEFRALDQKIDNNFSALLDECSIFEPSLRRRYSGAIVKLSSVFSKQTLRKYPPS